MIAKMDVWVLKQNAVKEDSPVKQIVIFGAGGLGREVMWLLQRNNQKEPQYEILGFVDDEKYAQGQPINGMPVVGDTQWLMERKEPLCVAVCLGDSQVRRQVCEKLRQVPALSFPNLFAEDAIVSDTVAFGQGCILCLGCAITVNVNIGDFFIANAGCIVGHDCELDDYVTMYPCSSLSGNVKVGDCVEVGTGARVIQQKSIGANTLIGAGAVVISDISADCTAVGVPAQSIPHDKK